MTRQLQISVSLVCIAIGFSSCLKTRAQLRGDSEGMETASSAPTPALPVQDVQLQGHYAIDEIKSEITRIEGRLEDLSRLSNSSNSVEKEEFRKLEVKVGELEQTQLTLVEAVKKLQEKPVLDPQEIFRKAKAQYEEQDYEGAAVTFGEYLQSPKAKQVEEATYSRGESYLKLKEYKKAIVEYSKFPEKFSHSPRMPAVLYKIALCFDSLKMKDDARGFYQELAEKFPKSPEAKKIQKK